MSKHAAVLENVEINTSLHKHCKYKVGTFSVSNLKKKVIDDYRNQFIKIVEDNPLLVPVGMPAQDYALQTFSRQAAEIISPTRRGGETQLRIFGGIFPELEIIDDKGCRIPFDDVERLGNVEVDVELRVGSCDTFEGRRVRFIVDNLIVKS